LVYCVIVLLWIGYLVFEGFDFGVGMLLLVVGCGIDVVSIDINWCVLFNIIGFVWDGNEVWLLVVGELVDELGVVVVGEYDWFVGGEDCVEFFV